MNSRRENKPPRFTDHYQEHGAVVSVCFERQILPRTFEHTLNYLIEQKLNLSIFHHKYRNENTGRRAYETALLLKIVLLA